MVRSLLVRGMLAGILAGLLTAGFGYAFGEPLVDHAIAFEDHVNELAGVAAEPELVSRAVQGTVGLLTGVLVYGAALGGLFALVFAYAHNRLGRWRPRATAAVLAVAAFVLLVLVPQVKYPANPPSVGSPDTIGLRTALYFGMLALSLAAGVAALGTGRSLVARLGAWNAALAGGAAFLVAMAVVMLVLPAVDEVPDGFPAAMLWRFRLASLGMELVLWTVLGLVFGLAAERRLAVPDRGAARPRLAL